MKKEKNKKSKADNSNIGKILIDCLTKEQLAQLLDFLIDIGNISGYKKKLKELSPDLAETISRVFDLRTEKNKSVPILERLVSDEKNLENWSLLWDEWKSIVSEVGDEEGEYVIQEKHWEAPFFDGYALAEDLEKIGEEMFPLIEQTYALVKQPELFFEAIEELDSEISSYPGWMGNNDGCLLGKKVSQCVLKWFWLSTQKNAQPGTKLLNRIFELEDKYENVYLDEAAKVSFFSELPETICREIYELLKSSKFEKSVNDTYSAWHKINHIYKGKFDSIK